MMRNITFYLSLVLSVSLGGWCEDKETPQLAGEPYVYTEWETFYKEDGLPSDHIFTLKSDGDRLWVGTEDGLALYENGQWKSWTEKEGLPFNIVTGLAVDKKKGDLWVGMFGGGIARFSGGRFDHFHQLNSGLVNDVVYGMTVLGDEVWVATTAGVSSYNTVTGEWEIFTEKNAPMDEIWCYNIDASEKTQKVYVAVWGGGILEWDTRTKTWDAHHDPDKEMEIDLYRDDGLIHIITTAVSFVEDTMWCSTYFGMSRYDGRHWRGYTRVDSGLINDFINFIKGRSATSAYCCTDLGLAVIADSPTNTWVTYKRDSEDAKTWTAHMMVDNHIVRSVPTNLTLPNHFIIFVEFQGDDVWVGTGHGLARGIGKGYYPGLKKTQTVSNESQTSE